MKPVNGSQSNHTVNLGINHRSPIIPAYHAKTPLYNPDQDLSANLMSFRDEIINQMVNLHAKTTGHLEKKIDSLKLQNQALNLKLDRIINALVKSQHEQPSHLSNITLPTTIPPTARGSTSTRNTTTSTSYYQQP